MTLKLPEGEEINKVLSIYLSKEIQMLVKKLTKVVKGSC